jgi:hypothetical protein
MDYGPERASKFSYLGAMASTVSPPAALAPAPPSCDPRPVRPSRDPIMPAEFHIDVSRGLVRSKGTGVLTLAVVLDHMDRLVKHPDFRPEFNQLFDFRGHTMPALTFDDVTELAEKTVFSPRSQRAFVVSADWQFGYGRMFATMRSVRGEPGIMVFRTMKEATDWLGIPEEPDPLPKQDVNSPGTPTP